MPGAESLVLDLGTGLRFWGQTLPTDGTFRGHAFVTHLHWDHVQGLPFFAPINCPGATLDIYAPMQDGCSVGDAFEEFMRPPYFPVRPSDLFGDIRFHDVTQTDLVVGPATVKVRNVPHVGATNGYRFDLGGVSIAYISDHQEPMDGSGSIADSVLELCDGVDLLIHDAQYTADEFAVKSNWGHCTFDYAVRVAAASGARRLALFHHDPSHGDLVLDELLVSARLRAAELAVMEVVAAAEGTSFVLTPAVTDALVADVPIAQA